MGWVMLSLRRNELQSSIQDKQFDLLQLNSRMRKLSNLSSAIGDGHITPSEIAGVGGELFGDALDFMGYSNEAATEAAMLQTDYYSSIYGGLTAEQYYNNPSLTSQASLHYDANGNMNTEMMYQEFYEQALKDYAETVVMPRLKELEEELLNQKTEMEAELESQEAELQVVKDNISESIQNSTIQL